MDMFPEIKELWLLDIKAKKREYNRRYYLKNRERINAKRRQNRLNDRQKILEIEKSRRLLGEPIHR